METTNACTAARRRVTTSDATPQIAAAGPEFLKGLDDFEWGLRKMNTSDKPRYIEAYDKTRAVLARPDLSMKKRLLAVVGIMRDMRDSCVVAN